MLPAGDGIIINNASVSGLRNPTPDWPFTPHPGRAALAHPLGRRWNTPRAGLRINAVSPGRVETSMMLPRASPT